MDFLNFIFSDKICHLPDKVLIYTYGDTFTSSINRLKKKRQASHDNADWFF